MRTELLPSSNVCLNEASREDLDWPGIYAVRGLHKSILRSSTAQNSARQAVQEEMRFILFVRCRREGSELTREVLRAAGMAPSHEEEGRAPAGEVLHEPGNINPGGGGLRGALRGRPPRLIDEFDRQHTQNVCTIIDVGFSCHGHASHQGLTLWICALLVVSFRSFTVVAQSFGSVNSRHSDTRIGKTYQSGCEFGNTSQNLFHRLLIYADHNCLACKLQPTICSGELAT